MSSRAGKMASSAPSSPERPVAEGGLYPHPNPSPEGRGASEELPCPRISAGHLAQDARAHAPGLVAEILGRGCMIEIRVLGQPGQGVLHEHGPVLDRAPHPGS